MLNRRENPRSLVGPVRTLQKLAFTLLTCTVFGLLSGSPAWAVGTPVVQIGGDADYFIIRFVCCEPDCFAQVYRGTDPRLGVYYVVQAGNTRFNFLTSIYGTHGHIEFHGGDGNDRFANGTPFPSIAYGGAGNDHLAGGTNSDWFDGGPDNDYVEGKLGDDHLFGGSGMDYIYGGYGTDWLYDGVPGNDIFDAVFAGWDPDPSIDSSGDFLSDVTTGAELAYAFYDHSRHENSRDNDWYTLNGRYQP